MVEDFLGNRVVKERIKVLEERMKNLLKMIKNDPDKQRNGLLDNLRGLRAEYERLQKLSSNQAIKNDNFLPVKKRRGVNIADKIDVITASGERYFYSDCSRYKFLPENKINQEVVLIPLDTSRNILKFENTFSPINHQGSGVDSSPIISLSQSEHQKEADTIYKNTEDSVDNLEYSDILSTLYSDQE